MNIISKRSLVVVLIALLLIAMPSLVACDSLLGSTGRLSAQYDDAHILYEGDDLDTVKSHLTVTYTDTTGVTSEVTGFSLSGTLAVGDCELTITYKGLTAKITVNVVELIQSKTITFVADGAVVSTVEYAPDGTITLPEVPQKDGYTGAWEEYVLGGNLTVNAAYTPIVYTIPMWMNLTLQTPIPFLSQ